MCSERQSAIVRAAWSRKTHTCMYRGDMLQAECIAGALSMHSLYSPDYVFTVLVNIFISKTHNHFLSAILVL